MFVGCLRGGSYIFYGVFCGDFVDKYGAFVEYSQHIRNPFEMYSRRKIILKMYLIDKEEVTL